MLHAGRDRPNENVTFALLALAGASFALLQSLVAPALGTIEDELGAPATTGAWIITSYLVAASVATPIAGRVGDMVGKKRVLVVVLALLATGTVVSALATTLTVMVVGRVVQGLGGAVFPLAFGIIRDEFPREKVPSAIALVSAILGIGGGLGILLAGPIVDTLGVHWLFWGPLIPVAIACVGTILWIPESPVKTGGRVNLVGAFLLGTWLVALLVAVSEGSAWGWTSARTLGLIAFAAVGCVVWIVAEARSAIPLVDMRMMRRRPVWTINLSGLLFGFGMFGSFILIPALVRTPASTGVGFGASVTQAGLYMLPSTIAMLVTSILVGRISRRTGSRVLLLAGALVASASFALLALANAYPWEVYLASTLFGVGLGLAWSSMANLVVEAVPPEQTGVASGMNTIMRTIGGAIGGQLMAAIIASSLAADGLPTDRGFTAAFLTAAAAMLLAFGAALLIPSRLAASHPTVTHVQVAEAT